MRRRMEPSRRRSQRGGGRGSPLGRVGARRCRRRVSRPYGPPRRTPRPRAPRRRRSTGGPSLRPVARTEAAPLLRRGSETPGRGRTQSGRCRRVEETLNRKPPSRQTARPMTCTAPRPPTPESVPMRWALAPSQRRPRRRVPTATPRRCGPRRPQVAAAVVRRRKARKWRRPPRRSAQKRARKEEPGERGCRPYFRRLAILPPQCGPLGDHWIQLFCFAPQSPSSAP